MYRHELLSILTMVVDTQTYTYNKITENHTQEKLRKFLLISVGYINVIIQFVILLCKLSPLGETR